jgi:hypothetical protein
MKSQLIVISAFVLSMSAGMSLAEAGAPNAVPSFAPAPPDAAKAADPAAGFAKAVQATAEASKKANAAKQTLQNAPVAVKEQAQGAALQGLKPAVPTEAPVLKLDEAAAKLAPAAKDAEKLAKPANPSLPH